MKDDKPGKKGPGKRKTDEEAKRADGNDNDAGFNEGAQRFGDSEESDFLSNNANKWNDSDGESGVGDEQDEDGNDDYEDFGSRLEDEKDKSKKKSSKRRSL